MSSRPQKTPRVPEGAEITDVEGKIIVRIQSHYGERLKQQGISDMTVLRFIRGYKDDAHHEQKTMEMLGAMLHWREEMKVSQVAVAKYDKEELFKSIWTSGLHGRDKMGHLIYVTKIGAVDASKLYKHFTIEEVINFHIKEMEMIQNLKDQLYRDTGRRLYKQMVILDLKGLGMSHLGSKFTDPFKKFSKIDQEMYPETLYKMFFVNAGFIVKSMWAIAAPFIDPITKQNILFGEHDMKQYIDVDQIPKYLGGTCRCEKCLLSPFIAGPEADHRPAVTINPDRGSVTNPNSPAQTAASSPMGAEGAPHDALSLHSQAPHANGTPERHHRHSRSKSRSRKRSHSPRHAHANTNGEADEKQGGMKLS